MGTRVSWMTSNSPLSQPDSEAILLSAAALCSCAPSFSIVCLLFAMLLNQHVPGRLAVPGQPSASIALGLVFVFVIAVAVAAPLV